MKDFNLSDFDVQTLTSQRELCLWFEEAALHTKDVKKLANWILKEALAVVNERSISIQELPFSPNDLAELVNTIDDGRITSKQAKDVFAQMLATGKTPKDIIVASGYEQVSDVNAIEKFVDEVLAENASAIEDWKNGKTNVAGWLMGQVMKKSQGRANPSEATKLVTKKLSELK